MDYYNLQYYSIQTKSQMIQRNIVAATININNQQITPTYTTTNNKTNTPSFEQDIKSLHSAFLKLTKALIHFKRKKLLQKHNTNVAYPILPPLQTVNHLYDQHGIKLSLDNLLRNNPRWYQALNNEFGRLSQRKMILESDAQMS